MSEPYLLLWLEAPLQSWGHDSKFGRRDSLDFPTKSGVLGLLCCALGAAGEQKEWLANWAERDMVVQAFVRTGKENEPVARLPMLRDFHMIGSGYDLSNPWEALMETRLISGKPRTSAGKGAKITYRYYLQDMAFAVALQAPQAELEILVNALNNPVWDVYLGRKNCVPTEFIAQGIHANLEAALEAAQEFAQNKEAKRVPVFKVLQGEHEGEVLTLNDVPLQFGENKQYRDRRVTIIKE